MADALARYNSGKPIFFYTWAPNWTIFKFKPGKDVVWINVPEINPTEAQKDMVDRLTVSDIEGAVSNPVKLGFVVADIRIVANKKFLAANPAAKKFFKHFTLPLGDINEQNTLMEEGEKSRRISSGMPMNGSPRIKQNGKAGSKSQKSSNVNNHSHI